MITGVLKLDIFTQFLARMRMNTNDVFFQKQNIISYFLFGNTIKLLTTIHYLFQNKVGTKGALH